MGTAVKEYEQTLKQCLAVLDFLPNQFIKYDDKTKLTTYKLGDEIEQTLQHFNPPEELLSAAEI